MSKTCYDPKIDDAILKIIDRDKETRFNILVVEIEELLTIHLKQKKKKLKKTESMGIRRTISRHLTFLSEDNNKVLLWTRPTTPGKAGSIKYTPQAEIKRKYGFLTIDYSGKRGICKEWKENMKDKEIKERKRKKKIILFLLIAFAYGYTGYKPTSIKQAGNIAIKDDKGKLIDVSPYFEKGFSIEDLTRKDSQLSAIHSILRVNRFTKSEIGEMLEELKKGKDIILRPAIGNDGKEERYDIEGDVLKELLIWCCNILSNFISMMNQYWFILGRKPKPEEAQWFSFIVGEEATMNLFQKIDKNRVEKKSIRELYIEYHFKGTDLDKEIIDRDLNARKAYYLDKYHLDIFTKKGMEEYIFTQSKESFALRLHCDLIASDKEKYQELAKEEKYQWLFEELADLINPPFSKSKYKVKLT